ncbi:glycoside hydrolase family 16 protein [Hydnum rufescens UP504]|uniref:Glycoside hydrolase family 16 protein n=1 Tax=Hydnum rufescens UP504 TaxID=1448309 RepID=A0A9P6B052_9AGAM|nr:glycoside hydrolase family 16 protein [Hydnum rufescens UP504]
MTHKRVPSFPFTSGPNASPLRYSHPRSPSRSPSPSPSPSPPPPAITDYGDQPQIIAASESSQLLSVPSVAAKLISYHGERIWILKLLNQMVTPFLPWSIFTWRGLANVGFLALLSLTLLILFTGYPLLMGLRAKPSKLGGYNLGGINASGQVPTQTWWPSPEFSSRQTGNLEYYDPAAITTTEDGYLEIMLSQMETHDLNYQGGLFHHGINSVSLEATLKTAVNVSLPGDPRYPGLWPAIWMMGNLGRAGYGASLQGMWPYSYDACDYGTLANQSLAGQPPTAMTAKGPLSFQQGQRLSACTCPGEPHPGPKRSDGTFVGRAAPELDIFEASSGEGIGTVSQSCQFAPFDDDYAWRNSSSDVRIYNGTRTHLNAYRGGMYQEAVSAVSATRQDAWQFNGRKFATYGVEYVPGPNGHITWVNDGEPSWTVFSSSIGPNPNTNISQRNIPEEPLYIIMNLGISHGFGYTMSAYTKIQTIGIFSFVELHLESLLKVGCSPEAFPTEKYINQYSEGSYPPESFGTRCCQSNVLILSIAYTNPNLTVWVNDGTGASYNETMPKNRLIDQC